MSHFNVVVCLSDRAGKLARLAAESDGDSREVKAAVESRLETLLAPYDENSETAPYRDYEDGGPEDYWIYRSLREADEHERNGTGIKPYKPDGIGWSSDSSKQTEAEQRLKIARQAALFRSLPEPVTWEAVIDMGKIIYPGEDNDWPVVDEDGRAYRMSTYNPESKWDYWRVGGRWGGFFLHKPDADTAAVLRPEKGWDSPEHFKFYSCDGGRKDALDLAKMRDDAAEQAAETYNAYHALTDHLPEALPWRVFADNVSEGNGYTIDQARAEYHAQARIQALAGTDFQWRENVIEEFSVSAALYENRARAGAVPGFALVTTDGRWMEQGRMGWFALTDATDESRTGYWEAANAYIESLPDDAWLVAVDCHI